MEGAVDLFDKPREPKAFDSIRIGLASPERIRQWSHGEVKKPETINYRTFKPEKDGLFCAKIFGPVKDWECNCGKYKRMKHRGIVCEKCHVEVIRSIVRRERLGHIELACPVAHIWFFKAPPSRIGYLLDLTIKELERVIYYESYVVIDPGTSGIERGNLITEDEFRRFKGNPGFSAMMGAEAIRELLERLDLDELAEELRRSLRPRVKVKHVKDSDFQVNQIVDKLHFDEVSETLMDKGASPPEGKVVRIAVQPSKKAVKRLQIVEDLRHSNTNGRPANKPEWTILTVIPVLPPDLRPLVPLEGGRFATSDLNDLYRRVLNRNNRLKKLLLLKAPEVIVRNEKRMLQESVDALLDNSRRSRPVVAPHNRPVRSLTDMLRGKQGRFRQNLLGKRVDYSGRSVIVIGPHLDIHQCGLPKRMALELFKPFIYNRLQLEGLAPTIKSARKMVDSEHADVWRVLNEIVKNHTVMLNRAPTLHRLGVQSFKPILIEGKAIEVPALVCAAFNSDFDGDQMAVHVPLTTRAQAESLALMLASNNILSPANGKPVAVPSKDIVLGCYYLSRMRKKQPDDRTFSNIGQVLTVFALEELELLDAVRVRMPVWQCEKCGFHIQSRETPHKCPECWGQDFKPSTAWLCEKCGFLLYRSKPSKRCSSCGGRGTMKHRNVVVTSPGRALFNDEMPKGYPYVNEVLNKSILANHILQVFTLYGRARAASVLNNLKDLGFKYSTYAGASISISDITIPKEKYEIVDEADARLVEVMTDYARGRITDGERHNKTVDIWTTAKSKVARMVTSSLLASRAEGARIDLGDAEGFNPIYMMLASGARGSEEQILQLAGLRGLMSKTSGEIIETPINANFREGLSVLEYFISTHGGRKGLADTALKTSNAGYLTRILVDVAQEAVVTEDDCGTISGLVMTALYEGMTEIAPLRDRILGRVALEDVVAPNGRVIVEANEEIDEVKAREIERAGIRKVGIRSVLTCEARNGICVKCYGRNLARGTLVEVGEAAGIIAAQSIGEPGTQLTLRTFHIGGTASITVEENMIAAQEAGTLVYDEGLITVERAIVQEVEPDEENVTPTDESTESEWVVSSRRGGHVSIVGAGGRTLAKHYVGHGASIKVADGGKVGKGDRILEWDPYAKVIMTDKAGTVEYVDIVPGATISEDFDTLSGESTNVIISEEAAEQEKKAADGSKEEKILTPHLVIRSDDGAVAGEYQLPIGAHLMVKEGERIGAGTVLAKLYKELSKTKDITGGLPRVVELFQARKPKEKAIIARNKGRVKYGKITKRFFEIIVRSHLVKITSSGDSDLIVGSYVEDEMYMAVSAELEEQSKKPPECEYEEDKYYIPRGKHMTVLDGDVVEAGDALMEGSPDPQDILEALGEEELQKFLVNEIQEVYRLQGITINDKHIALIIRQMLKRSVVIDPGDTRFLPEQHVGNFEKLEENQSIQKLVKVVRIGDSRFKYHQLVSPDELDRENRIVLERGGRPAVGQPAAPAKTKPLLLGITKASLSTDSFISAASFQDTTRVLTGASVAGKVDNLLGPKENVIVGRVIPAGTGAKLHDVEPKLSIEMDELARIDEESKAIEQPEAGPIS
ncbi:DNA-directed RNA polymerase subunit beta' [bacterium]|nr:DNA-directed RNA polymerase subunit beta' [bacterium]